MQTLACKRLPGMLRKHCGYLEKDSFSTPPHPIYIQHKHHKKASSIIFFLLWPLYPQSSQNFPLPIFSSQQLWLLFECILIFADSTLCCDMPE